MGLVDQLHCILLLPKGWESFSGPMPAAVLRTVHCVIHSLWASQHAQFLFQKSNFLPGSAPSAVPSWCYVSSQLQQSPPALGIFCHSSTVMVQLHQLAFPSQITKLARGPASLWATICVTIQVLDVCQTSDSWTVLCRGAVPAYDSAMPLLPVEIPSGPTITTLADPCSIMTSADGTAWNLRDVACSCPSDL